MTRRVSLSRSDVAALDRNAEALGVPTARLMENAGRAVAKAVAGRYADGRVLVLAGLGNNGGDGAVAARHLKDQGGDVEVIVVGPKEQVRTVIARDALDAARRAGVSVNEYQDAKLRKALDAAAVVVDAILGVGVEGPLREPVATIVNVVRASGRDVVAVDLPTGHDSPTPLPARLTVTMHDRKAGMDERLCGEIVVADIGIPERAQTHVGPGDLVARYPLTPQTSRKGKMGKILIVGGGRYTGAPVLAGMGAFATGTDLVHMALPEDARRAAQVALYEAIVHPLNGNRLDRAHGPFVEELLEEADVLLVGPGLGRDPDTLAAVRDLVDAAVRSGKKCVVDGDAFSAFKNHDARVLQGEGFVLTPHAGEFKILSGQKLPEDEPGRLRIVQDWLGDRPGIVLLKGREDLIVSRDTHTLNAAHDPVMTTAGTGDVLAGVTAALLGRGMSPFDAARVACYLNGAAGVRARRELGPGVRARDVARRIPVVLAEHFPAG